MPTVRRILRGARELARRIFRRGGIPAAAAPAAAAPAAEAAPRKAKSGSH